MTATTIAVLRQNIHGITAQEYAEALESRLSDVTIRLASTPREERELLEIADIATGLTLTTEQLDLASNLSLFGCVYAGTGHLDLDEFTERGIAVTNGSGVHAENISEYVLGAILTFTRQFHQAFHQQQRREWRSFQTRELAGSTVTVVGLGAIGQAVVERLEPFDVDTVGVRYTPEKGGPTDDVYGFDEIHEAVVDAEYVVLACPLTDATEQLIDNDVIRTMEPNAVLVNIARGKVVDTDALLSNLRTNQIGGAVLDVTDPEPLPEDHPLWGMRNVLITPHNAGYTPKYFERRADILAENVTRLAEGRDLRNQVV